MSWLIALAAAAASFPVSYFVSSWWFKRELRNRDDDTDHEDDNDHDDD